MSLTADLVSNEGMKTSEVVLRFVLNTDRRSRPCSEIHQLPVCWNWTSCTVTQSRLIDTRVVLRTERKRLSIGVQTLVCGHELWLKRHRLKWFTILSECLLTDPEHTAGIIHRIGPGNTWAATRKSLRMCLGRRRDKLGRPFLSPFSTEIRRYDRNKDPPLQQFEFFYQNKMRQV